MKIKKTVAGQSIGEKERVKRDNACALYKI